MARRARYRVIAEKVGGGVNRGWAGYVLEGERQRPSPNRHESRSMNLRTAAVLGSTLTVAAGLALGTGNASAAGPPAAATAFSSAVITPAGGAVSGFGITATFAPGAVTTDRLIILGNWPNGLDVTPPSGTAVKTFGLQECNTDATACTSEFGNFPNSPAGTERIHGHAVDYTPGTPCPTPRGTPTSGPTPPSSSPSPRRPGRTRCTSTTPTTPPPRARTRRSCPAPVTVHR